MYLSPSAAHCDTESTWPFLCHSYQFLALLTFIVSLGFNFSATHRMALPWRWFCRGLFFAASSHFFIMGQVFTSLVLFWPSVMAFGMFWHTQCQLLQQQRAREPVWKKYARSAAAGLSSVLGGVSSLRLATMLFDMFKPKPTVAKKRVPPFRRCPGAMRATGRCQNPLCPMCGDALPGNYCARPGDIFGNAEIRSANARPNQQSFVNGKMKVEPMQNMYFDIAAQCAVPPETQQVYMQSPTRMARAEPAERPSTSMRPSPGDSESSMSEDFCCETTQDVGSPSETEALQDAVQPSPPKPEPVAAAPRAAPVNNGPARNGLGDLMSMVSDLLAPQNGGASPQVGQLDLSALISMAGQLAAQFPPDAPQDELFKAAMNMVTQVATSPASDNPEQEAVADSPPKNEKEDKAPPQKEIAIDAPSPEVPMHVPDNEVEPAERMPEESPTDQALE